MAYQSLGGGYAGRFGEGMRNPSVGPPSTRPAPGLQKPLGTPGGTPGVPRFPGGDPGRGERERLQAIYDSQSDRPRSGLDMSFKDSRGTHTYSQGAFAGQGRGGSGRKSKYKPWGGSDIAAPDIPGFEGYAGSTWGGSTWEAPEMGAIDPRVDTRAIVDATRHTIDERMATEGGEAAAALGKLGVLSSGGGRGGGYAGTLGESERARDRDLAGMYYQYDYDAAQQDANRASQAREGDLSRSLSAHEGAQGRSLAAHEGAEGRGYGSAGRRGEYDRWKYGAEVGAKDRADAESRRRHQELMAQYGM